jgi:hypothetical protein
MTRSLMPTPEVQESRAAGDFAIRPVAGEGAGVTITRRA